MTIKDIVRIDDFGRIQILNVYASSVNKEYFKTEAENILKQIGINKYEIIGDFNKQSTIDNDFDSSYIVINGKMPEELKQVINSNYNELLDADNDGLSIDEEKLYMTDPNNPDTDGDGYSDGDEVKAGYNPNGEGVL